MRFALMNGGRRSAVLIVIVIAAMVAIMVAAAMIAIVIAAAMPTVVATVIAIAVVVSWRSDKNAAAVTIAIRTAAAVGSPMKTDAAAPRDERDVGSRSR
jgi:hypothetical protein